METKEYDLFELEIQPDNSIKAVLTTFDNYKDYANGKVVDEEDLRNDISKSIESLANGDLDGQPEEIKRLGRNLYKAIFPGEVGTLFERTLQTVVNDRQGRFLNHWLRIIIDVHLKSDALKWPLEFLYCQNQTCWLATDKPLITLSRRVLGHMVDLNPQPPPLRVLVVISKPEDLEGAITTRVLQEIGKLANTEFVSDNSKESHKKMDVKVLGEVKDYERIPGIEYLDQLATYVSLQMTNQTWQPHVLHFIGHGKFEKTEGYLGLADIDNKVDWLSADNFSHVFNFWHPRLVLLQACESAVSGTEPAFISLADYLVKHSIPAVVAMQFTITNDNAILFATGFYEAIRDGKSIDQAVQNGRWQISCSQAHWAEHHFGTPVLFTYHPDAIIETQSYQSSGIRTGSLEPTNRKLPKTLNPSDYVSSLAERALGWLGNESLNVQQATTYLKKAQKTLPEKSSKARLVAEAIESLSVWGDIDTARDTLQNFLEQLSDTSTITFQGKQSGSSTQEVEEPVTKAPPKLGASGNNFDSPR